MHSSSASAAAANVSGGTSGGTNNSTSVSGVARSQNSAESSGGHNVSPTGVATRKKQRKKTVAPRKAAPNVPMKPVAVDMNKLDIEALRRYKKHYSLRTKTTGRTVTHKKAELVQAVARHFAAQTVDENDTIEKFVFALRSRVD
eukprot:TRINITY_DN541_c3_g1_i1.p2 TRINITY_DN541_c3_g1~~TRINITY_DN541_c3_g1_i1.p2  ORF type:complete len:165 (-),score=37.53 TRINITY_DN541_c3_g1_i1:668-1099(-)